MAEKRDTVYWVGRTIGAVLTALIGGILASGGIWAIVTIWRLILG